MRLGGRSATVAVLIPLGIGRPGSAGQSGEVILVAAEDSRNVIVVDGKE